MRTANRVASEWKTERFRRQPKRSPYNFEEKPAFLIQFFYKAIVGRALRLPDTPAGFGRAGVFGVCLLMMVLPFSSRGADVMHLKDGQVIECEIEALTDNILTYATYVDLGGGKTASAKRTISPHVVDYIEFNPLPGEEEVLKNPGAANAEALETLWSGIFGNLHRPRSNAGKIGLLLAGALLKSEEEYGWNRALSLYDRIREKDWNPENRQAAVQGRLRTLIRMGDLETALHEAQQLASESEDPALLIEARYALAQVDFENLKALEEENPKWEEDDAVRPDRNRLFHRTVDQFLWPYLFHGTYEESAARGLVAAAEVYESAGMIEESRSCLGDVAKLYPQTASAAKAAEKAKTLQVTENDEKKTD